MLPGPSSSDPARDAAALLRRMGLATILVTLPIGAILSRRGAVVLFPIGVALLVAAALLDGELRSLKPRLGRLAVSSGCLAAGLATVWAAGSLVWTPAPGSAAERLLSLTGTLLLAALAYLSLPDRTRSANLYLIPVGTILAALVAVAVWAMGTTGVSLGAPGEDGRLAERGSVLIVLLVWPAIGWLGSRGRDGQAACLAVVVAGAAVLAPSPAVAIALAVGALAYVFATISMPVGTILVGVAAALAIVTAPLAAVVLSPDLGRLVPGLAPELAAWKATVAADPVRLVTGHGFGAMVGRRLADAGGIVRLPSTPLFQAWYDLGIVAAFLAAAAIWTGVRRAAAAETPLLPSMLGAVATTVTLATIGLEGGPAWQPIAVVVLALSFVAAGRGQYRTSRPRAGNPAASGRGPRGRSLARPQASASFTKAD